MILCDVVAENGKFLNVKMLYDIFAQNRDCEDSMF